MIEQYKKSAFTLFKFLIITYALLFSIKFFILKDNPFPLIKAILKGKLAKLPSEGIFLYDYFLYMSLACTFFPIPTLPVVIFMGKSFIPFYVALIGAVATTLANLNDYCIVSTIFISKKVQQVHNTKFYNFLIKYFQKSPFIIVAIGSFLPLSIDFIRLLAISHQYPIAKFSLANFCGRFIRYFILAMFGYSFQISNKVILIIFAFFFLLTLALKKWTSVQEIDFSKKT